MLSRVEVCLVGTGNPENLGAVARLLANFDVRRLTLVAPRALPDEPRASIVGRTARDRLAGARIVASLAEAVRDASYVVGFSARRGGERPMVGLRALPSWLAARAPTGAVTLVFGPEDTGLHAADVDGCDLVVAIETPGPLSSLNLAQAVALALWELSRPAGAATATAASRGGATRSELEALVEHAFAALEAVGHAAGADRVRRAVFLRRLVADAALRQDEVRALHGICAAVVRAVASDR